MKILINIILIKINYFIFLIRLFKLYLFFFLVIVPYSIDFVGQLLIQDKQ